jgi:polar amino acid transport system substrate-binding protein
VPTAFDRDPDYYRKELSLKMSCSYGPGRYDPLYEEKGLDYPAGFVRWTEKRNMQAFQQMMASGAIDIGYLTSHRYPLDKAAEAYDLILNKTEPYLGILIEYDQSRELFRERITVAANRQVAAVPVPGISFIGAGSYAMSHLLPNLPSDSSITRRGVATSSGTSARSVAERFNFAFCGADVSDVYADPETHAVFIATRHDSHARYVLGALAAGKHVFVEKPLALNEAELDAIAAALPAAGTSLMVGFNRRFSPLVREIRSQLGTGPMAMIYRVNAGFISADNWVQDVEVGGGRVIGEVCHFIDTMTYLCGSLPERVHAFVMAGAEQLADTVVINLRFANGAIGSLCYFANGPKRMPKEYLEVYKGGQSAVLSDFRELTTHGAKGTKRRKLFSQDKGQGEMVRQVLQSLREGAPAPIPFAEIRAVSLATIRALQSLRERAELSVDEAGRQ